METNVAEIDRRVSTDIFALENLTTRTGKILAARLNVVGYGSSTKKDLTMLIEIIADHPPQKNHIIRYICPDTYAVNNVLTEAGVYNERDLCDRTIRVLEASDGQYVALDHRAAPCRQKSSDRLRRQSTVVVNSHPVYQA
jgi:hypothetical protein